MAKPHSQTGHGPLGGTEDESSLAHGEASRGDAEGDGGTEADWDIPAAPDNSPLSRILGVVLVVVLAGVFSFVAYRKYDEARRNPTANQTVADNASPSDPNADAGATTPAGERNATGQNGATQTDASKAAASFAQNRPASADAFGSLDDQAPNRSANGSPNSLQRDRQAPGSAAFAQARTTSNTNPAAPREDANPFGDLGNSPEQPKQQPPTQGEPPQQFAAGTPNNSAAAAGSHIKDDANGGFPGAGSPNHAIVAGGVPHGAGEHRPAGVTAADADMQNLFPNEGAPQHDRPTPNPQNLAGRATPLEPAAMNRTAQLQDLTGQVRPGQIPVAQAQPGQIQPSRTPPTQSEPLDNEALDGSHSPAHAALGERGVAQIQPDSRRPKPDAAMSAIPSAGTAKTGRAEALLAGKEREPSGDDSPFGNSPSPTAAPRGVPQSTDRSHSTLSPVQTSSTTNISAAGARSPAASTDDPFGGDRSAMNGRFAEKSAPSPSAERGFSQPGRLSSGAGSVTAVGTTNDAADYYVVQPQDNFWTISRKKYGTSRFFHALAELNKERIPDAGRMRPGMKVSTPPAEILEERYSQFLPPGTKVQVAAGYDVFAKVTPTGFQVGPDGTPKYRTGEHDTLSEIAAKHLGRSSRWIQIYEMNRDKLSNPNQLKVGTELVLPVDASSIGMSSEEDERR